MAPASSGVRDYVGMFAVTAGLGCQQLVDKYVAIVGGMYVSCEEIITG